MKNNGTADYLSLYDKERKKVDKKLQKIFSEKNPRSLYEPAAYITESQGKRLRPLLVLFSAKAVGGKFKNVYNASVAVELLHNFTLVHDDIMDNADKRRGMPTLHKKYDLSTAILTGDSLLSVAYQYLLKDCNGNARAVLASFTKGLVEVCEGQSLDKEFELRSEVTLEEYITMIEKKTAAMARMCCEVGALLCNAKKKEVNALTRFGKNIGIAFQIQDDLLDLIADEAEFGKVVGGDLIEGKKTYLFLKALEKAQGEEKEQIRKIITNKGASPIEVPMYRNLFEKLGVIDDARDAIRSYSTKALKALKYLRKDEDREIFRWLADSLIKRSR